MLTADQWIERQARLDAARAERKQIRGQVGVWPMPDDTPLEVAPGRGDLTYTSGSVPTIPQALQLVGPYIASFSHIFMTQPWVAAAIMRMMTWASRVPLHVYRRDQADPNNNKRVAANEHPLAALIENPWKGGSQVQLIHAMLGPVLVHGHSVIEMQSGAGGALALINHDWRYCMPTMPRRNVLDGFRFDADQPYRQDVPIESVLFTRWWSPIFPLGVSPLQQLGVTLQIEDAAQRMQRANLGNANRTSGVVTMHENYLGYDIKERIKIMNWLREDVTNLHAGPENAGRPMLLPPGLDWKTGAQTMVEAALIDQRKITREEVAAVFQIPPPLMGILDRATYSNIETQRDMTYTDVVGPQLVLLEQTMNAQLVRDFLGEEDVYVAFDFSAVLRGDRLQQIQAIRGAIDSALLTPNEGRGILGEPKMGVQGMDSTYLPLVNNLAEVGVPLQAQQSAGDFPPPDDQNPTQQPGQAPDQSPQDFPGQRGENGHGPIEGFKDLVVAAGYRPKR